MPTRQAAKRAIHINIGVGQSKDTIVREVRGSHGILALEMERCQKYGRIEVANRCRLSRLAPMLAAGVSLTLLNRVRSHCDFGMPFAASLLSCMSGTGRCSKHHQPLSTQRAELDESRQFAHGFGRPQKADLRERTLGQRVRTGPSRVCHHKAKSYVEGS